MSLPLPLEHLVNGGLLLSRPEVRADLDVDVHIACLLLELLRLLVSSVRLLKLALTLLLLWLRERATLHIGYLQLRVGFGKTLIDLETEVTRGAESGHIKLKTV